MKAALDRTEGKESICCEGPDNEADEKDHEKSEDEKEVLIPDAQGRKGRQFTNSAKDTQPC